ncbi:MAG: M20/M25/M40 family metallo-hydrolase [Chitinispirillales bacterium]|jgi:di/tripeptidase|nr:M20/M25/M40 family metallo-hydrolase [Chitinispirillales bacterium]
MKKHKHILFVPFVLCVLLTYCGDTGTNSNQCGCTEDVAAKTPYEYFVDLSKLPRCTGSEKAASDYLKSFAEQLGFEIFQDAMFNLLIKKQGSKGRESEPPIILQAHIDMVCNKDLAVNHNFETDPIIPVIEGDWVRSQDRTTLGADNGSGVSMIMAILASNCISHPPVEALLTVQEEIGLIGALYFDVSKLSGQRLINLDNITEKFLLAGSKQNDNPEIIIPMLPKALAKIANLPDWPYREDSPLRDKMVKVFKDFYKEEPVIASINNRVAGVECMAFAARMPEADMISIGPTIQNIHTPDERMSLSSYNRVYDYLVKILEEL